MKKALTLAALIAAGFASATAVQAAEGPLMVRVRALTMVVDNTNSTTNVAPALGQLVAEDKVFPEVDFTYFITKNLAAELILTYPQRHDLQFAGVDIGSVKHLPPTLTLQYHFLPDGTIRPYVGAGVNYTRFMSPKINAQPALAKLGVNGGQGVDAPIDLDRNSFGFALQVGTDVKVTDNWFVNLDAKYVRIKADNVHITGGPLAGTNLEKVTDLGVNPWLFSVGVGYRF